MAKTQQKLYRFYRSNLPTIVWDPTRNKPLAEFIDGQFYTEDKGVAEKLKALNYPEIPLDLTDPPDIYFEKGRSLEEGENVKVMPGGMTEEVAAQKEKTEAKQKELAEKAAKVQEEKSPAEIALEKQQEDETKTEQTVKKAEKKPFSKASAAAKKAVAKTSPAKRKLKRRKKG